MENQLSPEKTEPLVFILADQAVCHLATMTSTLWACACARLCNCRAVIPHVNRFADRTQQAAFRHQKVTSPLVPSKIKSPAGGRILEPSYSPKATSSSRGFVLAIYIYRCLDHVGEGSWELLPDSRLFVFSDNRCGPPTVEMADPKEDFKEIIERFQMVKGMADILLDFVKGEGSLESTQHFFFQGRVFVDQARRTFQKLKEFNQKLPLKAKNWQVVDGVEKVFFLCNEFKEVLEETPIGLKAKCKKVDNLAKLATEIMNEGCLTLSLYLEKEKPKAAPGDRHSRLIATLNHLFTTADILKIYEENTMFFGAGQRALMASPPNPTLFSIESVPQNAAEACLKALQNPNLPGCTGTELRWSLLEAVDCLLCFAEYHRASEKNEKETELNREPRLEDFTLLEKFADCSVTLIPLESAP